MSDRYQCFLIGQQGNLLGREEFTATNDDEARVLARSLIQGRKAATAFELWKGIQCLKTAASFLFSCGTLDYLMVAF